MKKFKLFKIFSIFAIATAGAVAVGVGTKAPKAEAAEAVSYSGSIIIQKNSDNGVWTSRTKLVGYLFDGSSNTWGTAVANDANKYQVYSWSGLSFDPTTIIILNVADNWSGMDTGIPVKFYNGTY